MAYTIKNFAQTVTYTVNDSTANTNAVSLTLLGKSLPNYGTYFNQNFVWLMENFCSDSANPPPYPVQGQLWWDSSYKFLNVYNGTTWNTVYGNLSALNVNGAVTTSGTATVGNVISTNGFYYANGAAYGINYSNANVASYLPTYTGTFGTLSSLTTSGAITSGGTITGASQIIGYHTGAIGANTPNSVVATSVTTSSGGQHIGYLTGALGANTPNTVVATSVTTSSGGQHIGYLTGALGANTPNTVVATSVTTSSGGQLIGYLTGAIGANSANTGRFTTVTATSTYFPGGNSSVDIGTNGLLFANLYNSNYYVGNLITPLANVTVDIGSTSSYFKTAYIVNATVANSIVPTANATANIGSVNKWYNSIYGSSFYGTSTTAQYADLAEKYLLDQDYPIGTVVMIGGKAEATQHDGRLVRAIGAISTNPAYKMNDSLENGTYIALKGRVPVRVFGPVIKGQSLRGGPNGLAIAEDQSSAYTFAIAMESVDSVVGAVIEAVIL